MADFGWSLFYKRVDNFTFNQSADFTRALMVAELEVIHKTTFSLFEPRLWGTDWNCTGPFQTPMSQQHCSGPSLSFSLLRPHMCTELATAGSVAYAYRCCEFTICWDKLRFNEAKGLLSNGWWLFSVCTCWIDILIAILLTWSASLCLPISHV